MGRNIQVSRESILQAGLEMIIEEGYQQVTVKTLARKLNCSTQPIVWQFKDMESFRKCLADYAIKYMNEKMSFPDVGAMLSFGSIGIAWVETALEQPNLVKYIFALMDYRDANKPDGEVKCDLRAMMGAETEETLAKAISAELSCSVEQARHLMLTMELFTMGLVFMIVFGNLKISEEEARAVLGQTCLTQMVGIGVDPKIAEGFLHIRKKETKND